MKATAHANDGMKGAVAFEFDDVGRDGVGNKTTSVDGGEFETGKAFTREGQRTPVEVECDCVGSLDGERGVRFGVSGKDGA